VKSHDKEDKLFKYALPLEQKMDIIDDIMKKSKDKENKESMEGGE
jgi:hypothetical protein